MKILSGYDGTEVAREAVALAERHATAFNAEVFILRSMKESHELQLNDMEKADRELEELKHRFEKKNIPCETRLIKSDLTAGEELVKFADEKNADEIIVGVRKRSKVGKLLLGSTAQYVILEATCPVVAVK